MPIPRFLSSTLAALVACLAAAAPLAAGAAPKTVCTITVNSPDEKETFRRHLPPGDYQFVELVERGRPDWLASACQQHVSCDALIISGHFDGGEEFYTDRYDASEYLSVEEMERASCSDSCPGVFAQLKEVYLFGCNTLKPEPRQTASAEIVRALLRSGNAPADAARLSALLGEKHAESNRDRMRHIFRNVPVIYGFSSKAPLGRYAGPLLDRYFQTAPAGEVGGGQVSAKLLGLFAPSSMTFTSGLTDGESQASLRSDACHFVDDRLSPAQKVAFLHEILQRDMAEVRMFLGHLERFAAAVGPVQRLAPETAAAFASIAGDGAARERYLAFARDADEPAVQTRMMALARNIGWLSPAQEQAEFMRMISDRIARNAIGRDEVDLACARGRQGNQDAALRPLADGALRSGKIAPAAALACLGSAEAHARVVRAVTSANADDITIAQVYLRHRPLADAGELRAVAAAIGRMPASGAQVRALETLAQQRLADPESLREIARLFPLAKSVDVQRAIAGILIRSDYRVLGAADLARSLQQYRIKSPDGSDVIDALIRVLQAS
ncbi:hypothetical protein [Ramlibacter alkalitolerans]|uniref:Uncharacterized protein n=1 Tax=Ramlibacter alkalitolerans TaxID=2039631 RepID=A0ABS1JJY3_9BURK|nr:hypothetical protein [Ramlibacter alkalitolerans]MBL0424125.1 hypothetical protein [Ramlibacter alkalitolerans]